MRIAPHLPLPAVTGFVRLFETIEGGASSPHPHRPALPASVERAACSVLLGEPGRALQLLGLGPVGSLPDIRRADPEVTAFVKVGGVGSASQ